MSHICLFNISCKGDVTLSLQLDLFSVVSSTLIIIFLLNFVLLLFII